MGRKILAGPSRHYRLAWAAPSPRPWKRATPAGRLPVRAGFSVLNQVLLHQSVIGLETKAALDKYGIKPDIIIGCAGGGSNLGGLISPFMGEKLRGEADYQLHRRGARLLPQLHPGPVCLRFLRHRHGLPPGRRCTPWAAASSPQPTTPAACGITA